MKIAFLNKGIYEFAAGMTDAVGGLERDQWLLSRALAGKGWTAQVGVRGVLPPGVFGPDAVKVDVRCFVVVNAGSATDGRRAVALPAGQFFAFDGVSGKYDLPVSSPVTVDYQAGLILATATQLCQ